MKTLLIGICLLMTGAALANEKVVVCHYDEDGYDEEDISVHISDMHVIQSVKYQAYIGPEKLFYKNSSGYFEYTNSTLIIKKTFSFGNDLATGILVTTYKNGGEVLSVQQFSCEQK